MDDPSIKTKKDSKAMYIPIMEELFARHAPPGTTTFDFVREEIVEIATALGTGVPKNLGDFIYSFKFRQPLPPSIIAALPDGKAWILRNIGMSKYRFELGNLSRIIPRTDMIAIKIPDSTPEIIRMYAKGDEQAVLSRVRYNRLIDVFLGIAAYSLQNHLRTSVKGIGQIEVDELYVGINEDGAQFIVPVQAKVKDDQHSVVQTLQDVALCKEKFPALICRAVSAQFIESKETIVMFELVEQDGEVKVKTEKHYQLVNGSEIKAADLKSYRGNL